MSTAVSLVRVAKVARNIGRASSSAAILARALRVIERHRRGLGPGSFLNDLVVLANRGAADARRMAAARRLARRHARPQMIFHKARWWQLEIPFRAWRDGRGFWEGWQDLVAPYILMAFEDIPRDIPLSEVWPDLRRRLRRAIELDLLGHTLDGRLRFSADAGEEPIVPEAVAEAADLSLELAHSLQILTPEAQGFLLEYHGAGSAGHKAMARRLGISDENLRQGASRLLRKLRRINP